MAEAQEDRNLVKCPICLEQYVQPRKMANCRHSFCEACIVAYVSTLMDSNEAEEEIQCPVCKTINPAPNDKSNIPVWIKSLELTKDMEKMKSCFDESKGQKECDSCHTYGISLRASKFCFNCFEIFCLPCSMGRHSGRLYRNHTVVSIGALDKDSTEKEDSEEFRILKEYSYCSKHAEYPVDYYCEEDDCLCCAACVVMTHRKCGNVTCLKEDNLENDPKTELEKNKNMIDNLSMFAKKIIATKRKFVDDIKTQSENIREKLQVIRTKVNSLLDAVGEVTVDHMNAITKNVSLMQENECEILNEALGGLQAYTSLIDKTILYGSVGHFYRIRQKVRDQIRRQKAIVMDAYERLGNTEIYLKLETTLQTLLDLEITDTNKLANIIERRKKIDLPTHPELELLKNYLVLKTAEKRVSENYISRHSPTYSDLSFLRNGRAILVDTYTEYCSATNAEYKVVQSRKLPACNRCSSDDGIVAVSIRNERKIFLLGPDEQLKVLREITTRTNPVAIHCLVNGHIAVAWADPVAFGIISDDRIPKETIYFCQDKAGRVLKSFAYIAVDEVRKHVIQPCSVDKAIYCFDYEGNPKFKYENASLSNPKGVALDWDGNIYQCSNSESAVHVVSPTGQAIRIIKEGCPESPIAIAFKKNGEEFAITRAQRDDRVVTFFSLQAKINVRKTAF